MTVLVILVNHCIPSSILLHYYHNIIAAGVTGCSSQTANHCTVTVLNEQNHSVLYKQLTKYSSNWREIATLLGFLPSELDNIEARPLLLSGAPRSFLSAMLAEWLQWVPGDSRGSTSFPTLEDLKVSLESVQGLTALAKTIGI